MSTASKIEWTEVTWNPTTGCDRISSGCDHCYALTLARRLKAMGQPKYQNDGDPRTSGPGFAVTVHQDTLWEPLRWRKPRVVFVNSMSDLFHARVPDSFIASVFGVMAMTPQHTYQVLTKRPRRMRTVLSAPAFWFRVNDAADAADDALTAINPRWPGVPSLDPVPWPLPNVWAGTSIENDDYTWRADDLRQAPAAVRFLSCEPLLGPLPSLDLDGIHWVIAGGESGPDHRKLDLDWVRGIRDRCAAQGTAFFFKQVGGPTPKAGGREIDGRTWDEMPALAGSTR
jgi:protein gp37